MTDGELRDQVLTALLGDALLWDLAVQARVGALVRVLRAGSRGAVEVRVTGGVVTLQGKGAGLAYERLATVFPGRVFLAPVPRA